MRKKQNKKEEQSKDDKYTFDAEKLNYCAHINIERERSVHRFADKMVEAVASDPNIVKIVEWPLAHGVSYDRMRQWKKRYPYFAEKYEQCMRMLEVRRYKMMIDKKFNPFPIAHTQYLYDPEWKEANENNDARRKKIDGVKSGNVFVEMIQAEDTKEVPVKKDNKKGNE